MRAVPLPGYWRDLGRPRPYLQGHRDLLAGKVDVFDHPGRPDHPHWPDRTAARVRAAPSSDSLVSPGCDVAGEVVNSVLGPGVVVEQGARVEDCVLFEDVVVERGARGAHSDRRRAHPDRPGAVVGEAPNSRVARDEDIVLVGLGTTIGAAGCPRERAWSPARPRESPGRPGNLALVASANAWEASKVTGYRGIYRKVPWWR